MGSVNQLRRGSRVPFALELFSIVGLALMAGFLFNMSVVTAPALNRLSAEQALAAWKGINSTVRNPLFAGVAFGTALLVVACAAFAWRSPLRVWCLSFALLYLVGVIGVTFTVNIGTNRAIVAATAPPPELQRILSTRVLAEPHPFTVSSAPHEDRLRLAVKASGDWTQYLYDHLRPGMLARVDGAYGMFNYKTGGRQQIWIAGGIGLTPFLSWIRDSNGQLSDYRIDFYYCMRVPEDALFLTEIQRAAAQRSHFRPHISYSNTDGHLSMEKIMATSGPITGKEIYMCGPIAMTQALEKALMKQGALASHIHFEEFNFR